MTKYHTANLRNVWMEGKEGKDLIPNISTGYIQCWFG